MQPKMHRKWETIKVLLGNPGFEPWFGVEPALNGFREPLAIPGSGEKWDLTDLGARLLEREASGVVRIGGARDPTTRTEVNVRHCHLVRSWSWNEVRMT